VSSASGLSSAAGIELLAPRGLLLLGLLVPLVLLYILRIERRRRRVASTWLWAAAQRDLMARSPWRRFVAQVPLVLEALALAALALALARPATRGRGFAGDHVAVILDASASMSALVARASPGDPPETRFDRAKRAALDLVSGLGPGSDALVLEAARDARVLAPLDRDLTRVRAAIERARPRDVEGDLEQAIALAADRLRPLSGTRRIVVLTDGDLAHPSSPTAISAAGLPVSVITVGTPVDNAAIVRVDVRSGRSASGAEEAQAFLMVANFGRAPRDLYVTMREDNASDVLASRRVVVAPGERLPVLLDFRPSAGDHGKGLVFDIAPHDAMPADDVAYGRVPAGDRLPVHLAGSSPWLERALASDPEVELHTGPVAELARADVPRDALVVIAGACPDDAPGGDLLIVDPPAGRCLGATVGDAIERPEVTSWDDGDARLRFVSLDGVHVARSFALDPGGPSARLVRARQGTIVADASTPARTATVLGFDPGESDWPLKASFVVFVRNVLEQARAHRASGTSGTSGATLAIRTGEPVRVSLPEGAAALAATAPSGEALEVSRRAGVAVVADTSRAGFYRVTWAGPRPGSALVPVNLTSAAESDLSRSLAALPDVPAGAQVPVSSAAALADPDAHHEHAWLLALVALAFVLGDVAWLGRSRDPAALVRRRRILVAGMIAGALPAIVVAVEWAASAREGYLRFERPGLVALTLASTWFAGVWLGRRRDAASPWRRGLADALAMAAVLSLSLAAAGPELGRPLDRLTVLALVDRSRSIDLVPGAEQRVRRELDVAELGMRDDDRVGVIAFAAEAATEDPPRPRSTLPAPQRAILGRDATDLGAAIRRALAEAPADAATRIVLVSDGVATRGDAMAAAAAAVSADIPVDALALEQRPVPDLRVVALRAPARAAEGEAIDLRLVTASPAPAEVEIRVSRDGVLVSKAHATIGAGEDVLRIRERAEGPGLQRYDVAITALDPALDPSPDDNEGSAFVRVRGQAAALVLEGEPGKAAFMAHALERTGFRVTVGGVAGVPADLGELAGYDLVLLSDIRASDVAPTQLEVLASYVKDLGGGLLLMGGDRGMGPGGYGRTPIEEVSPVSFDLKQEQRRASLAEVIGIDISGSMGARVSGHTKLELANEAAARSAELLGAGDRLGVEHVDTAVRWSVPLGPVIDKAAIDRAIRGVGVGGGGIFVDITLDAAYAALAAERVNLKHLLLFADGDDAEQMGGCEARVAAAFRQGITTSVVALGTGADVPGLEALSRLGNGRFYLIEDATRLPAVFAQETVLAARSAIVEKAFRVDPGAPSAVTTGVDLGAAPELGGYVVTVAKPRASTLLRGPEGDPILAVWAAGLGRTAAFTSDLVDRWGHAWTRWEGAARLLGQVARDVARKGEDPRVRVEADAAAGELRLRATVASDDGRAQSFRRLRVHVAGPEGFARDVPLEATGAGIYAATVPLLRPGAYIAVTRDELGGDALGTTGAVLSAGDELRPTGSDLVLLGRIADLTGGKRRSTLAGIFADRPPRRFAYEELARALLVLGALGLLLAVAARRLAVPDAVPRTLTRIRRALVPARDAAPLAAATPHGALAALAEARHRERGRERVPDPPRRPATERGAPPPSSSSDATLSPTQAASRGGEAPPRSGDAEPHRDASGRPLTAAEILLARRKGRPPSGS
jgi:uncharacterized membrane protein